VAASSRCFELLLCGGSIKVSHQLRQPLGNALLLNSVLGMTGYYFLLLSKATARDE
jgi:hypothetical protein